MATTTGAFGRFGAAFFAGLNVLQLVGWTAVMIAQGAAALTGLTGWPLGIWCAALAVLIAVWIVIGLGGASRLAMVAMGLLAVLCVLLTVRILRLPGGLAAAGGGGEALPFWAAFEISAAMPLSWLPLISDYTKEAERPVAATAVSAAVYTLTSLWMFALGMLLAGSGCAVLAEGVAKVGQGVLVPGLIVITLSTVTTTFLDAYSAGESAKLIWSWLEPRLVGVVVCAVGAVLAVVGIVDRYIDFLYLIASVFAPMAAVLLVSYYGTKGGRPVGNFLAWLAGFLAYQFATSSPIGPTLTSMLAAAALAAALALLPRRP